MATTMANDLLVAYLKVASDNSRKVPLENGDELRIVRDKQPPGFHFIHDVYGLVHSALDWREEAIARLIDEGHMVIVKETAINEAFVKQNHPVVISWIEIGIRKESVEMVSKTLLRKAGIRVSLRIKFGGLDCENKTLREVFSKWKASKQFSIESSKDAAGVGLNPPEDVIKAELYDHQKQGLRWMVDREEWPLTDDGSSELPPFWDGRDDGVYRVELSCFTTLKRPQMIRGGILADESGMGKTLTLLSLIAYTKPKHTDSNAYNSAAACVDSEQKCMRRSIRRCGNKSKSPFISSHVRKKQKADNFHIEHDDNVSIEWRPTLVVCPPSVLATWKGQIKMHTWPGSLKVCTYHGKNKTKDPNLLRQHDLVLTTYNIVVSEEKSDSGILNKIDWWRVVLDDIHVLKGSSSRPITPFINLKANCRWAVTGKPIHEDYKTYDLCHSLAFLQVYPYCDKIDMEVFTGCLFQESRPTLRLEVLMGIFSLRRTMPGRSIQNHMVVLSKDERDLYNEMKANWTAPFLGPRTSQAAVLGLWQSCNSSALCRLSCAEMSNFKDLSRKKKELLKRWVHVIEEEADYSCPVCLDQPEDAVITPCGHLFCKSCIMPLFETKQKSVCPMCRRSLKKRDLFCPQVRKSLSLEEKMKTVIEEETSSKGKMSSKVAALLNLLLKSRKEGPGKKSVVLSQFQRMLMLVDGVLSQAGFDVMRIDNGRAKTKIIKEFSDAESSVVLLTSYKALSNTPGLDVSAASNVYLIEPCWSAHMEEEALSRIHRHGKRLEKFNIIRLVCKDTMEERVLEMRKKKPPYGNSNSRREVNMNMFGDFDRKLMEYLWRVDEVGAAC